MHTALQTAPDAGALFVRALRAAAPYVHAHHGRTFVVAFGGEAALRPDFSAFLYDLALLHSLGVKLVLVHGARPQIDTAIAARGLVPQFAGRLRVTDAPSMEAVRSAVGALRMDIEARLSTGLSGTPMGSANLRVAGGNWVTARPVGVRGGVDHLYTGEVRRVDVAAIRESLGIGRVALLSPVGYSPSGETYNLRAEDIACAAAVGLGADKLIFVLDAELPAPGDTSGVGDAGQLSLSAARSLLGADDTESAFSPGDRARIAAAFDACSGGVKRVHLIGPETEGALLRELYTRDGCGLMVHAERDYEQTRQAGHDDIAGILGLIRPLEAAGVLVPRAREALELQIEHYIVMVRDGLVIGCCAVLPYPEAGSGELACVAVHPDYRDAGRASELLQRAESLARQRGYQSLFCLTTHTADWFIEHGFQPGSADDLPPRRRQSWNTQRNSRVLVKTLV